MACANDISFEQATRNLNILNTIEAVIANENQIPPATDFLTGENLHGDAEITIIEQPTKNYGFRYSTDGKRIPRIPGTRSTPEKQTCTEIQISGFQGRAVVVVSCVTKDEPYRPHPNKLVGKDCVEGVCTTLVTSECMRVKFQDLAILRVTMKEVKTSLKQREQLKVNPFGYVYPNKKSKSTLDRMIDLNVVRLCFQAYLENPLDGKFTIPLKPVVSEPIFNKRQTRELSIIQLCSCTCKVDGGRENIILCGKVTKNDIRVDFYEEDSQGERVWCTGALPSRVHKQNAIVFTIPPYWAMNISEPVRVFMQLYRPSDGMTSEPRPFEYLPLRTAPMVGVNRKRVKVDAQARLTPQKNIGADFFWNIPPAGLQDEARAANWVMIPQNVLQDEARAANFDITPQNKIGSESQLLNIEDYQIPSEVLQNQLQEMDIENLGPSFSNLSITDICSCLQSK